MRLIKKIALGLLGGLFVGAVVLGVGGRTVMSAILLMEGLTPAWSLDGTVDVIAFGAIVGAVTGVVYVLVRKYLPGSRLVKGLLAGLVLFGVMVLIRPPSARSAMAGFPDLTAPVLLMFGGICLIYGVALGIVVDGLIGRFEQKVF